MMRDSLRHKLADGRSIVEVLLEMEQNIGLLAAYAHQLEARIKWMEIRSVNNGPKPQLRSAHHGTARDPATNGASSRHPE